MYTTLWIIWLAQFVAVEGAAVITRTPGATLSQHVWGWIGLKHKSAGWRWRRASVLALLVWLVAHLPFGL